MKLFIKLSALVLIATTLFSCKKTQKTLVMAEVNPPDSVVGQMDMYFANEVKRLTKGEITIELNASSILGDETSVVSEMFESQNIDLARISAFVLTSHSAEKSTILTIPYMFNDREHFWKFAKSEIASEILLEPSRRENGVRGLYFAEEGFRHFFSTKPLNSIQDLKGQTIRTNGDPILNAVVEDLGAKSVQVPFYDVVKEMIIGSVDAAEQPIVNYKSNYFDSAAPNVILDGHTIGVIEVIITNKAWSKLSNSQQSALLEAGANAAEFCRNICEDREKAVIDSLRATGVNIIEVSDKTPWQNACAETIREQAQKDIELYNKIVEMGR
ncbi:TRAP transporter substrate-binding protein [Treponema sp.]|uniref:TRAP transporter substrate-binding protein n=1 Tax=Treponema sp. TaxID=166 RepID=UPI00388CEF97